MGFEPTEACTSHAFAFCRVLLHGLLKTAEAALFTSREESVALCNSTQLSQMPLRLQLATVPS